MRRLLMGVAIAGLALATFAPVASAREHERGEVRGSFYTFNPSPFFYGPSWWYDPWYGPYGWDGYGYVPGPPIGTVKIESHLRGGSVFVDGGYAGRIGKLKKFHLRQGTHTIELRDARGRRIHEERVYVIAGRTIKIHGDDLD